MQELISNTLATICTNEGCVASIHMEVSSHLVYSISMVGRFPNKDRWLTYVTLYDDRLVFSYHHMPGGLSLLYADPDLFDKVQTAIKEVIALERACMP